jgi:hypothetical protein
MGSDFTLSEMVRREDPDGTLADLVDVISKESPILLDAKVTECNQGTSHKATRVATKPSGEERGYNSGVSQEAGVTETHIEPTCMLDGLSQIDDAILRHSPDKLGARMQEDSLFLSGMEETRADRLFNDGDGSTTVGDRSTYPNRINGFPFRSDYNTLSSPHVFDNAGGAASATANKMSIWIVQWGSHKVNLTVPRGDPGLTGQFGVKMDDFGREIITDAAGKKFPAWQTWFETHFGLFIWDPRTVKRIVNISSTNIDGVDDFSFNEDSLIRAYMSLKYQRQGAVIYAPEEVLTQMWIRGKDKSNTNFRNDKDQFGQNVTFFNNAPIRQLDALSKDEATIT